MYSKSLRRFRTTCLKAELHTKSVCQNILFLFSIPSRFRTGVWQHFCLSYEELSLRILSANYVNKDFCNLLNSHSQ